MYFTQLIVPHRVGTHPGHAYSRIVPEAAGFSTHNMAGRSSMTTSTLGVMSSCFSGASSRHRTMSNLVPSLSFPLADSDGGHGCVLPGTLLTRWVQVG